MLRREVIKLGSLFGLGAGTPSRFPYPGRPQPSPAVGPSSAVNVRARTVVVFGPSGTVTGVFVYRVGTTPGPGNGPIAWITTSTADPYGNAIDLNATPIGDINVTTLAYAALSNGGLQLGKAGTPPPTGTLPMRVKWLQAGEMQLITDAVTTLDTLADIRLRSVKSAAGNGFLPELALLSGTIIKVGSWAIVPPSGDTTGATDAGLINQLLAAGFNVELTPGLFYVNAAIAIPSWVTLKGPIQVSLPGGTPTSRIIATAGTTTMVSFSAAVSARLADVYLDGSGIGGAAGTVVSMSGAQFDVHLDNVHIEAPPHDGIGVSGRHLRFNRVTVHNAGNIGANVSNATDSTFTDCLMFGSNGANWILSNNSNCLLTACRAEWSATSDGFQFSGSTWSGTCVLAGCSTDHNAGNGVYFSSVGHTATEQGGVQIAGMKLHADQGEAMRINNCSMPISVSGLTIDAGQNPNTLVNYPTTGIHILSNTNDAVVISGAVIGAITTPWTWDGTGIVVRSGCVSLTGNPGAQVRAYLPDINGGTDVKGAGNGLAVAEGTNAKQGVATLAAGTVTVANTSVTATSRIHLTAQDNNSTGALRVSARTAGTSFVITSSNAADTGVVAYEMFEVG